MRASPLGPLSKIAVSAAEDVGLLVVFKLCGTDFGEEFGFAARRFLTFKSHFLTLPA